MTIKIGIDLDKTLLHCKSAVYYVLNKINWNKSEDLKHHEVSKNQPYRIKSINKVLKIFNPTEYKVYTNAVETINYLSNLGYEIHFVSNRPFWEPVISMTLESLKRCGVSYDKLVMGCNNKIAYVKQEKLDYFIDDIAFVCKNIVEKTEAESLLFKAILKDEEKCHLKLGQIQHFSNWEEIGNYIEEKETPKSPIFEDKTK